MSSSDSVEGDCALCLEPLPPFWDVERRVSAVCCGQYLCKNCKDQRDAVLERAIEEGTFGRQEEELARTCPLCRARNISASSGKIMMDMFEKGQLPLTFYRELACYLVHGQGGVERNVEKAVEVSKLGANKGDANCQHRVGCRYYEGTGGLPQSTTEAKRWHLAAMEQGHAIAEYNFAIVMRDEGNDAEYLRCMRGSASKGCNEACYLLGVALYYGECGLQKSSEEAIRAVSPAVEKGHVPSMCLLGEAMCSPDPQLPPPLPRDNPDFTKGVHWLRQAAEKGDQRANQALARMAPYWFQCAAGAGDEESTRRLKSIEKWASSVCFRCYDKSAPEKTFLRCSRCRAAWYCSKNCQVQHWKAAEGGHKQCCIKWE